MQERMSFRERGFGLAQLLVIDDDSHFRGMMCDLLDAYGHPALQCGSAREGLNLLAEHPVDVAIVDVNLREDSQLMRENGLFFLREVRLAEEDSPLWMKSGLPVVVFSGAISTEVNDPLALAAKSFGADATLAKPFPMTTLLELIDQWCPKQQADGAA